MGTEGDGIPNFGEPHVDEDPLDGIDNDGDGFFDEDFAAIGQEDYYVAHNDVSNSALEEHKPLNVNVTIRTHAWATHTLTISSV